MSSGYKWKAVLLLEGRGAEEMYMISSYFLCGTFGIWKRHVLSLEAQKAVFKDVPS